MQWQNYLVIAELHQGLNDKGKYYKKNIGKFKINNYDLEKNI